MKNYLFLFVFIMVFVFSQAQSIKALDTIYANDQKQVAMFFPSSITQGITGSENFVFTYNREKQQNFGLLQATPGEESNLLVIGDNGAIYSYIVQFNKHLSRLNYFIHDSESIGNIWPIDFLKAIKPIENRSHYEDNFNEISSFLLKKKQRIGHLQKRDQGIVLTIENIVFHKSELYFVIKLENRSSLDFDLNFLDLSIRTRQKGKRKSVQSLLQKSLFEYNVPASVKENETARFVYVFPKFSISQDRSVVFELNEKNGERNLILNISHRFINNPN